MKRYTLTMDLQVDDLEELRAAACEHAFKEGMTLAKWESMRDGPESDIAMLLVPRAEPSAAVTILDTVVEEAANG
jgi:hypothetical protein